MAQPYALTIRFRQQGNAASLDLETESGAGDGARMRLPYGDDLALVLQALDLAQHADPSQLLTRLPEADQQRLVELGLMVNNGFVSDVHARVGRTLLAELSAEPEAAAILDVARSEARAAGRGLALSLRFAQNATRFADLPWELLWEPDKAGLPLLLAQGGYSACVRYLTLPVPRPAPEPPGSALTILVASPRAGLTPELHQRHRQALRDALAPAIEAGKVKLVESDKRLSSAALLDLVAQHRPTVLSFYGHGELREGVGHLLLDDALGGDEWVPASRLAPLAQSGIRLLINQACRSDQPGADLLSGITGLLSSIGLPAIVAMQSYIRVSAATRLQAMLCRGLAEGQSVQEALAWARAALFAEEHDAASWYVPTLTVASRGEEPLVLLAAGPEQANFGPTTVAQAGARRGAASVARGVAGTSALTLLAASSVLPLLTGGFGWEVIAPLLAGLGGNALSSWLMSWAEKNLSRSGWLDKQAEEQALATLAGDLERQLAGDAALRDELAAYLEQTQAIPTALAVLGQQVDAQTDLLRDLQGRLKAQEMLLQALRADLRRSDLIQGRLHRLLLETLAEQTNTLLRAYGEGTERLSAEVRAVLAEVQTLRDELRAAAATPAASPAVAPKIQTGGVSFDSARIGSIGSVIGGDSYGGNRIEGDRHEYHGPITINPPATDRLERSIEAQLRSYLSALIPECNQLTLSDVDDLDPDQRTVPLDSVYIKLEVVRDTLTKGQQLDVHGFSPFTQTAIQALAARRQLVLLGPPGSGKSTFINHLAYCLARATLGDRQGLIDLGDAWPHGPVIPVRIVLRELAAWLAQQKRRLNAAQMLWRFVRDELGTGQELAAHLHTQTQNGQAIVLLDGLDEVPTTMLPQVRETIVSLRAAVPLMIVTCRVLDYAEPERQLEGWFDEQIVPLSDELQRQFIGRWYAVLKAKQRPVSGGDYDALREKLQGEVLNREELRRMAGNPLLLTMMSQLHAFRGELPAKRVLLYAECIDLLLRRWRPRVGRPDLRAVLGLPEWGNSETLRLLERLGYVTHQRTTPSNEQSQIPAETDLPRRLLLDTAEQFFQRYDLTKSLGRAEAFCNYIGQFSNGVLQQHGPMIFRFPHRTFQEYLAACRLTDQAGWDESATSNQRSLGARVLAVADQPQWREALLMAAGQLVLNRRPTDAMDMVEALVERYEQRPAEQYGDLVLAGELLAEIGPTQIRELGRSDQALLRTVVSNLVDLLELDVDGVSKADIIPRIRAGLALGQLGDPRPGVVSLEPDWREVPAGKFFLGSQPDDEGASADEQPQQKVTLPAFRIARYPVTNAQWRLFVEAGGYSEQQWWSETGWQMKVAEGWDKPRWWGDPRFNGANQPVVGISWYEATAYCRWLSAQLSYTVRLPSEAEWEKAARGGDGRSYPWGNTWVETRANAGVTSYSATTPVGCYPDGDSPYGILDMSGNVLEWTASPWTDSYSSSDGTTIDVEGTAEGYVFRGGAWGDDQWNARCTSRYGSRPSILYHGLGVRVAALTQEGG